MAWGGVTHPGRGSGATYPRGVGVGRVERPHGQPVGVRRSLFFELSVEALRDVGQTEGADRRPTDTVPETERPRRSKADRRPPI